MFFTNYLIINKSLYLPIIFSCGFLNTETQLKRKLERKKPKDRNLDEREHRNRPRADLETRVIHLQSISKTRRGNSVSIRIFCAQCPLLGDVDISRTLRAVSVYI